MKWPAPQLTFHVSRFTLTFHRFIVSTAVFRLKGVVAQSGHQPGDGQNAAAAPKFGHGRRLWICRLPLSRTTAGIRFGLSLISNPALLVRAEVLDLRAWTMPC